MRLVKSHCICGGKVWSVFRRRCLVSEKTIKSSMENYCNYFTMPKSILPHLFSLKNAMQRASTHNIKYLIGSHRLLIIMHQAKTAHLFTSIAKVCGTKNEPTSYTRTYIRQQVHHQSHSNRCLDQTKTGS